MAPHRLLGVAVLVLCVLAASANTVESSNANEPEFHTSASTVPKKPAPAVATPARKRPAGSSTAPHRIAKHAAGRSASGSPRTNQASRPAAANDPVNAQQNDISLPPLLPSSGELMPRLSRDIRGLPISITNGQLNPITYAPQGMAASDISAFTFQSDLFCSGAQLASRIGVCYLRANMLPQGVQTTHSALTTVMCVLEQAAPDCEPQLSSGLTFSAAGMLTVVTNGTLGPAVNQFFATTPLIIDGVHSSSRADTLLSSLINFKSGNIDIRSVVRTTNNGAITYTGSMFLNLFKGGPLA